MNRAFLLIRIILGQLELGLGDLVGLFGVISSIVILYEIAKTGSSVRVARLRRWSILSLVLGAMGLYSLSTIRNYREYIGVFRMASAAVTAFLMLSCLLLIAGWGIESRKMDRRSFLIGFLVLGLATLIGVWQEPGGRYLLVEVNSGNGYGHFFYHNGLWARYLPLGYDHEVGVFDADLSPDGSQMAFKSRSMLYVYGIDTGELRAVDEDALYLPYDTPVEWSPDGKAIGLACTSQWETSEICVFDLGTRQIHVLTDSRRYGNDAMSFWGSWSKGGEEILFQLSTHPDESGETEDSLRILDVSTGRVRTVIDESRLNLGLFRDIALSPDGRTILFTAHPLDDAYRSAIFRINTDGTGLRQLTEMGALIYYGPVWSPDGRSFYVGASDLENHHPEHFDLNGHRLMGLLFQDGRSMISWRNVKQTGGQ